MCVWFECVSVCVCVCVRARARARLYVCVRFECVCVCVRARARARSIWPIYFFMCVCTCENLFVYERKVLGGGILHSSQQSRPYSNSGAHHTVSQSVSIGKTKPACYK